MKRVWGVLFILFGRGDLLCAQAAAPEFRFNGYFRTTLGMSAGPEQTKFQAPGAGAKYRLGNENDSAFELKLTADLGAIPEGPKGSSMETVFLLTGYSEHATTNEKYLGSKIGPTDAKEFYVNFKHLLAGGSLWVGRRYYDRKLVYSNNHFWLNSVQGANVAAGLEKVDLGFAELDFTMINYEDEVRPAATKELSGLLLSRMAEARLKKIAMFDSKNELNLWFAYTDRPSQLTYEHRTGQGLGLWIDSSPLASATNTFVAILRQGAAVVQGDFNARPMREDYEYDLKDCQTMEWIDTLTIDSAAFSTQLNLGLKDERRGVNLENALVARRKSDHKIWTTAGISSIFYLTPIQGIALEFGFDKVQDDARQLKFAALNESGAYIPGTEKGEDGYLFKQTIAWQFAKGKGYYTRPAIRLFYTNADWADQYRGLVAPTVYGKKTQGWSTGIQTEVWW